MFDTPLTAPSHRLTVISLFAMLLMPLSAFSSPEAALQQFYKDINAKRCKEAIKLRDNYNIERCQQISEVVVHDTDTVFNNGEDSVISLSIDTYTSNAKQYFSGYVRLQAIDEHWRIIGPYKNKERYALGEYINDYLPADSHIDRHAETAPEQRLIEDALHVPETPDTERPAPTIEQLKYLSGKQEISGNYAHLLKDLRQQFPAIMQDQILLVDRSRNSLYLYDSSNLLLSFFPLLSLASKQVPNGLFTTGNTEQAPNNENTTIHLELLQPFSDETHNATRRYYIRDLLDRDQKNSLLLSPIDLAKLNNLLSGSVTIYLAN